MLKVAKYVVLLFALTVPTATFATSWAYIFVVWDGYMYEVTNDRVLAVGEQIGKVTSYSDMWSQRGNFSNHYPKGTKYFEIEGIEVREAIAVEVEDGHYKRAENRGQYENSPVTPQGLWTFVQNKWRYVGGVLLLFVVLSVFKTKILAKK